MAVSYAIEVKGLRKSFGAVPVLTSVDLRVERGTMLALLGPNGAGKTTTVRILTTLLAADGGTALVEGHDVARDPRAVRRLIGVTGQATAVDELLTGEENLEMMARLFGLRTRAARRRRAELLAEFGLEAVARRPVRTYSGGLRRRLDLAVGLINRPSVLFLDEPTTGFDPEARAAFHTLVRRLAAEHATTVLLTTHDLDEADRLADRILVLAGGRIVADGTSAELARRYAVEDEVRWTAGGRRHIAATSDSTAFARRLFHRHGDDLGELEVRRASLADTYTALVRRAEETGQRLPGGPGGAR